MKRIDFVPDVVLEDVDGKPLLGPDGQTQSITHERVLCTLVDHDAFAADEKGSAQLVRIYEARKAIRRQASETGAATHSAAAGGARGPSRQASPQKALVTGRLTWASLPLRAAMPGSARPALETS